MVRGRCWWDDDDGVGGDGEGWDEFLGLGGGMDNDDGSDSCDGRIPLR